MNILESKKWLDLPLEERREKVMEDIAANRRLHNGRIDLNNFHMLFLSPDNGSIGNARELIVGHAGGLDKRLNTGTPQALENGNSELFLSKTPREIFEDVDRITLEHRIDVEHMNTLIEEFDSLIQRDVLEPWNEEKLQRQIVITDELHEMLLPVYIDLRIEGYNDNDLGVS